MPVNLDGLRLLNITGAVSAKNIVMKHYADFLEEKIGKSLDNAGIPFVHESENKEQELDFYIPHLNVYIEVKQYHAPRISQQLERQENVIVLQGKRAVDVFCTLIASTSLLKSATNCLFPA